MIYSNKHAPPFALQIFRIKYVTIIDIEADCLLVTSEYTLSYPDAHDTVQRKILN